MEAPIEWYLSICKTLEEYGWRRLCSDPCCWVLLEPCATTSRDSAGGEPAAAGIPAAGGQVKDLSDSRVIAAAAGHVDDFLFAGVEQNPQTGNYTTRTTMASRKYVESSTFGRTHQISRRIHQETN